MQDGFTFKPSAHLQFVQGSRVSFEATGMFDYRDVFDFGVGFRSESGIIGLVRVDLFKYITLAYAYDFALSRIRYDGRHTHAASASASAGCGSRAAAKFDEAMRWSSRPDP